MATERVGKAVLDLNLDASGLLAGLEKVKTSSRQTDTEFEVLRQKSIKAGQDLAKMVENFRGDALVSEAVRAAQAINQIGGVSKLTKKELADVSATVAAATDKLKRMGAEVPPSLRKLSTELAAVEKHTTGSGSAFGSLGTAARALGPILPVASLAGAATAIFAVGKNAVDSAGQLMDLKDQTGLSTDLLQEMQAVAAETGVELSSLTDNAYKLGLNVSQGTKKAKDAAAELNLEWKALSAASPDERFRMVIAALEGVDDQTERNRLGTALFGKSFKDIAQSIEAGFTKIAASATKSTESQLANLAKLGDRWDRFVADSATNTRSFLAGVLQVYDDTLAAITLKIEKYSSMQQQQIRELQGQGGEGLADLLRQYDKPATDIYLPPEAGQGVEDYAAALKQARAEVRGLSAEQRTQLNAALALGGDAAQEYAAKIGLSDAALRLYSSTSKEGTKATNTLADAQNALFSRDAIERGHSYEKALGDVANVSKLTTDKKAELHAAVTAALTAYKALGQEAPQGLRAIELATRPLLTATQQMQRVLPAAAKSAEESLNAVGASLHDLPSWTLHETAVATGEAEAATRAWANATGGPLASALDLAKRKTDALGDATETLEEKYQRAGRRVTEIITQSMISGGGWEGALKGIGAEGGGKLGEMLGAKIAAGIGGKLGAALGGAAGPIGAALGSLAGAAAGKLLGGLFGGEGKKVNDLRDGFVGAAGGIHELNVKAQAAGLTLDRLLKAKTVKDYEAAVNELNAAFKRQADILAENTAAAETLFDEIMAAGSEGIPSAYQPAIDQLIALGLLTDDQAAKLRGLGDAGAVNIEKMERAIGVFKGRTDSLGDGFKQAKITETARDYINAIEDMKAGGADMGMVLDDAKEELSALAIQALKTGKALPANLKPYVEELAASNRLVDENGKAITDLSGMKWGDAIETEGQKTQRMWDKIIASIERLVTHIAGPLEDSLDRVTRDRTVNVDVDYRERGTDGRNHGQPEGDPTGFREGIFRGQFPVAGARAMLHGIESVVPRADELAFANRVLAERGVSTSTTTNSIAVLPAIMGAGLSAHEIGRQAAAYLTRSGLATNAEGVTRAIEKVMENYLVSYGGAAYGAR